MARLSHLLQLLAVMPGITSVAALAEDPSPQPAKLLEFAADVPVAAEVSLWPLGMNRGRDTPVFHNFMAQVRFSGEAQVLTCALRMPEVESQILPGTTARVALKCLQPFRVAPGLPDFRLHAGNRPIGQGRLQAAALRQVMCAAAAPPPTCNDRSP